ncbi:SRPBCC family protein [Nocardia uniformis]|uniref:SRPBCC family protein n=1 Tax=Nocardia uniformis TaxID=53432 RepID=A0A849CFP5_9NOCA|nr:SRPBCC family protein [Nocardia uniformis]NNH72241.1 SRPBCC family protein [Nocardia uniformis]
MASTHVEKDIEAPIDKVWEVAGDLRRWSEWNTMFTGWKGEPPAVPEPGAKLIAVLTVMGMANSVTLTIEEFEPLRRIALSGIGMAGAKVTLTMSVADLGGTTRMSSDVDFVSQMMVGAIGAAVEKAARQELAASLDKLAAIVE